MSYHTQEFHGFWNKQFHGYSVEFFSKTVFSKCKKVLKKLKFTQKNLRIYLIREINISFVYSLGSIFFYILLIIFWHYCYTKLIVFQFFI